MSDQAGEVEVPQGTWIDNLAGDFADPGAFLGAVTQIAGAGGVLDPASDEYDPFFATAIDTAPVYIGTKYFALSEGTPLFNPVTPDERFRILATMYARRQNVPIPGGVQELTVDTLVADRRDRILAGTFLSPTIDPATQAAVQTPADLAISELPPGSPLGFEESLTGPTTPGSGSFVNALETGGLPPEAPQGPPGQLTGQIPEGTGKARGADAKPQNSYSALIDAMLSDLGVADRYGSFQQNFDALERELTDGSGLDYTPVFQGSARELPLGIGPTPAKDSLSILARSGGESDLSNIQSLDQEDQAGNLREGFFGLGEGSPDLIKLQEDLFIGGFYGLSLGVEDIQWGEYDPRTIAAWEDALYRAVQFRRAGSRITLEDVISGGAERGAAAGRSLEPELEEDPTIITSQTDPDSIVEQVNAVASRWLGRNATKDEQRLIIALTHQSESQVAETTQSGETGTYTPTSILGISRRVLQQGNPGEFKGMQQLNQLNNLGSIINDARRPAVV